MVDFFGYVQLVYVPLLYALFFVSCFAVFKKHRFSVAQSIWFSVVSLACLEILWESLFNWNAIFNQQLLNPLYPVIQVVLRQLFISFPIFLWSYYNLKLGKPIVSLLFIISFGVQLMFMFLVSFNDSTLMLRGLWSIVLLVNIHFWRAPIGSLHSNKGFFVLFGLMFCFVSFPFLFSISNLENSKIYPMGYIVVDYFRYFVPLGSLFYLWIKNMRRKIK